MTWYAAHRAKIERARELTAQGNPAAALDVLDEAAAIREGEMERIQASRGAEGLLYPQKVRAALEALDFSLPDQAGLGCELLWAVNYIGALRVYRVTLEKRGG